jgi:molybdenum cofactor cytidylyltransferase
MAVTGLVLAAGGSRRLGRPKQLLPYRGRTLLDAALDLARGCGFEQVVVTVPADLAATLRERLDLSGLDVVAVPDAGTGCGASVRTGVPAVDARSDGLVLLLGDQPGVPVTAVRDLLARAGGQPLGVCRYDGGPGHPFWFRRDLFGELSGLHGDKAVWKLLHSGRWPVVEVPVAGPVPVDVDTWDDYRALLAADALSTDGGAAE